MSAIPTLDCQANVQGQIFIIVLEHKCPLGLHAHEKKKKKSLGFYGLNLTPLSNEGSPLHTPIKNYLYAKGIFDSAMTRQALFYLIPSLAERGDNVWGNSKTFTIAIQGFLFSFALVQASQES